MPVATATWTGTHEEIFREAREYCGEQIRGAPSFLKWGRRGQRWQSFPPCPGDDAGLVRGEVEDRGQPLLTSDTRRLLHKQSPQTLPASDRHMRIGLNDVHMIRDDFQWCRSDSWTLFGRPTPVSVDGQTVGEPSSRRNKVPRLRAPAEALRIRIPDRSNPQVRPAFEKP